MALFAIKRGDGSIDQAEAFNLADAYHTYGAPGNGEIVPWSDDFGTPRFVFANAADQKVALEGGAPEPAQPVEPAEPSAPSQPEGTA